LELIERHGLNIEQLDVKTGGGQARDVYVGLRVTNEKHFKSCVAEIAKRYQVRELERVWHFNTVDNACFTADFAAGIAHQMSLGPEGEQTLLVNANRIMQNTLRSNSDPYKPFYFVSQMADMLAFFYDEVYALATRVTHFTTEGGVCITAVEPPAGSTTWVLECDECFLVVDGGFCRYADELESVLRENVERWDELPHYLVLTHADIDHVGDCSRYDEVYASGRVIDNFMFENMGLVNWREQGLDGGAYNLVCKLLDGYVPPDHTRIRCLGEASPYGVQEELLRRIDTLELAPLKFEVWEGKGGHVRGETILIERDQRLCVTGDIFVNVHGQTRQQRDYNILAPFLNASVDTSPSLAAEERNALFELLGPGTWTFLCGHGAPLEKEI
jgi:glyoxylase-like metal-dependent hydrolase (beta-lactamase superfamily II)